MHTGSFTNKWPFSFTEESDFLYNRVSKKRLKPQVLIQAVSQETKEIKTIRQADENRKLTLKEKYEKIKQLLLEGNVKQKFAEA